MLTARRLRSFRMRNIMRKVAQAAQAADDGDDQAPAAAHHPPAAAEHGQRRPSTERPRSTERHR
jgi:hypothetical protein